ncbi:hypothetical protein R5R35_011449 [Gryllus longicercus]|uniref:Uncharacterized protein n=1 Tax=Gryllus longicercus TaxID=2509291 RepID=A0AAN9YVH1_9ORTH
MCEWKERKLKETNEKKRKKKKKFRLVMQSQATKGDKHFLVPENRHSRWKAKQEDLDIITKNAVSEEERQHKNLHVHIT